MKKLVITGLGMVTPVGNGNIGSNKRPALINRTTGKQQIHVFFPRFPLSFERTSP